MHALVCVCIVCCLYVVIHRLSAGLLCACTSVCVYCVLFVCCDTPSECGSPGCRHSDGSPQQHAELPEESSEDLQVLGERHRVEVRRTLKIINHSIVIVFHMDLCRGKLGFPDVGQ